MKSQLHVLLGLWLLMIYLSSASPFGNTGTQPFFNSTFFNSTNSVATNGTLISDEAATSAADAYQDSIQILYSRADAGYHAWHLWRGPQGVAVSPCSTNRFTYLYGIPENRPGDINNPPWIPTWSKWGVYLTDSKNPKYEDCYIYGPEWTGKVWSYGQLRCGDYLIVDMARDAQAGDPSIMCQGFTWHRAWVIEY